MLQTQNFHNYSLRGVKRTILELINNVVLNLPDKGSNLPPYDHKSNTKPLSYRTNDEKLSI